MRIEQPLHSRNLRFLEGKVAWGAGISEDGKLMLADAQPSGGMLIAVPENSLGKLLEGLAARGVATRAVIGRITEGDPGRIVVEQ